MSDTGTLVGDYLVVGSLEFGHGNELFEAVPPARTGIADDHVLLKVVAGVSDQVELGRITNELRTFAAVDSPFLVRLLDAGQDSDRVFYAMAYPSGGTLEKPVAPISDKGRLQAVAHAARGVHALHEAGIAHRNITPSSILLGDGGAKLANLGMAKSLQPEVSVSRLPQLSDIDYLDPSIILGGAHSRATDIWSLGAVLHWTMSGGAPLHPGRSEGDAFVAVRQVLAEPPMISPALTPDVSAIVQSALAPDPAERPDTAELMALQIEALVEQMS